VNWPLKMNIGENISFVSQSNHSKNTSISIYKDGCFVNFSILACTRDGIEAFLALITAVFCLGKVIKLFLVQHELWNQYIIFTAAIIEMCLLTINWMYSHMAIVDLISEMLKLIQFLVVCWFYCQIAARMSKKENLYQRVFLPSLVLTYVYFFILIIVGIIKVLNNEYQCLEPEWILLSCSEVALASVFLLLGTYITKQTNSLKTDGNYKRIVKRSLWGIISSFLLSSVVSMVYDIAMIFVGKDVHCKGLFVDIAPAFFVTHAIIKITKWLLPVWAMMIIFKPDSFTGERRNSDEEAEQPPIVQHSSIGVFKSTFRERGKSFNYKHLREPITEEEQQIVNANPVDGYLSVKKKKKKNRKRRSSRNPSEGSSSTAGGSSAATSVSPSRNGDMKNVV